MVIHYPVAAINAPPDGDAIIVRLQNLLADGEFSSLFLAQIGENPETIVVKCYNRAALQNNEQAMRRVLNEKWVMETLSLLPHPFVVGHRCSHIAGDACLLGMENVG